MTTQLIKQVLNFIHCKSLFLLLLVLGFFSPVFGQTEGEDQPSESNEKLSLRISFDAYKINDVYKLVAKTRAKINNRYQFINGVAVDFYSGESASKRLLGKGLTNEKGEVSLMISADQLSEISGPLTCWAIVENNVKYEDEEKSVLITPGLLDMELVVEDSIKTVKVHLAYPDSSGQMVPLEDASCQLYVKRLFGRLPIGDSEVTDEDGRIAFPFPEDLRGDEVGNITIIASFAENETLGNIEANKVISWGQPISEEHFFSQRELWSARSNSPISLIIIVNAVLIGVWGVIFYIFLEINRINKIGKMG